MTLDELKSLEYAIDRAWNAVLDHGRGAAEVLNDLVRHYPNEPGTRMAWVFMLDVTNRWNLCMTKHGGNTLQVAADVEGFIEERAKALSDAGSEW